MNDEIRELDRIKELLKDEYLSDNMTNEQKISIRKSIDANNRLLQTAFIDVYKIPNLIETLTQFINVMETNNLKLDRICNREELPPLCKGSVNTIIQQRISELEDKINDRINKIENRPKNIIDIISKISGIVLGWFPYMAIIIYIIAKGGIK